MICEEELDAITDWKSTTKISSEFVLQLLPGEDLLE